MAVTVTVAMAVANGAADPQYQGTVVPGKRCAPNPPPPPEHGIAGPVDHGTARLQNRGTAIFLLLCVSVERFNVCRLRHFFYPILYMFCRGFF